MMNSLGTISAGWAFVLVVLTLWVLPQESAWSRGTFFLQADQSAHKCNK